ncbi:hypothetical protein [Yersinia ruckeri]|uniref:hypothetical protein n=1 Tax=Yersinia ruckeri TaxID=29486 RepID=UPI0022380520|nr:hypothetical protein [Yersinia ruckeri]MCW6598821.1 hypothetical protein [Yersinia ruckeri]
MEYHVNFHNLANIKLPLTSETEVGRRGFQDIVILDVKYNLLGCEIDYIIHSKKYLAEMMNKRKTLFYRWGILDTSTLVKIDNLDLDSCSLITRNTDSYEDITGRLAELAPMIYNLILQSFAAPVAFSGKLTFDTNSRRVNDMLEAVHANTPLAREIMNSFFKVANIERNNMRYAMGATSQGYFEPLQNVQSGLSGLIGDFNAEYELDWRIEDIYNADELPQGLLKDELSGQLSQDSTVAVNCSFGKESLFTYEFMSRFNEKFPHISIFQHVVDQKAAGQYQSTYLKKVFTDLYYNHLPGQEEYRQIFICQSNFLPSLLEPICDVRLGAPICMLTHVFSQAQLLNIDLNQPAGTNIQMLLSGDEYERSISKEVQMTSTSTSTIHTYDYEQSPDIANTISNLSTHFGLPKFGSIMYPITGYQAQMVLDNVFSYSGLQTSCHASHVHNGGNCGKCQKCLRIGTVKALVGNPNNLDYKLTGEQIDSTVSWTSSDFFVTSMPADQDKYLSTVHEAFKQISIGKDYTISDTVAPADFVSDSLNLLAETPTHPHVLDVAGVEVLKVYLDQAVAKVLKMD